MTLAAFLRHLAFAGALALVSALIVAAMISARVMDVPNARSSHARPTPKGGGVGVVVAFMLGITVLYGYADFSRIADVYFRGVILAALAIAVVAFLDDLADWPFAVKLGAQAAAALAAAGTGMYVRVLNLPYLGPLDLGWAGFAVTLAWVLFVTNAMNFIDGLNGLAAGTGLVAALFLALLGAGQGAWFVYFAALLLAAGLAGFLPFNYPRARIFDVAFTLVRRALAGERLTEAHRGHLYQVAQRSGMDARWVAAVHWGFATLGGLDCLAFVQAPSSLKPVLPLLLLGPQLGWLGLVLRRARRAGLGRW
jgi:UDP-GlcNAc:undecaprenyl-phosphate GlcNAc-1-phosphate transferase